MPLHDQDEFSNDPGNRIGFTPPRKPLHKSMEIIPWRWLHMSLRFGLFAVFEFNFPLRGKHRSVF